MKDCSIQITGISIVPKSCMAIAGLWLIDTDIDRVRYHAEMARNHPEMQSMSLYRIEELLGVQQ